MHVMISKVGPVFPHYRLCSPCHLSHLDLSTEATDKHPGVCGDVHDSGRPWGCCLHWWERLRVQLLNSQCAILAKPVRAQFSVYSSLYIITEYLVSTTHLNTFINTVTMKWNIDQSLMHTVR